MRIDVCNGGCCLRDKCINVDTKICKVTDIEKDEEGIYIDCDGFERRWQV